MSCAGTVPAPREETLLLQLSDSPDLVAQVWTVMVRFCYQCYRLGLCLAHFAAAGSVLEQLVEGTNFIFFLLHQ